MNKLKNDIDKFINNVKEQFDIGVDFYNIWPYET